MCRLARSPAGEPGFQEPTTTIVLEYYSGWSRAYLHFRADGGQWTSMPGVKMESVQCTRMPRPEHRPHPPGAALPPPHPTPSPVPAGGGFLRAVADARPAARRHAAPGSNLKRLEISADVMEFVINDGEGHWDKDGNGNYMINVRSNLIEPSGPVAETPVETRP